MTPQEQFKKALQKAKRSLPKRQAILTIDKKTGKLQEKERSKPKHIEDDIQADCVDWFNASFSELRGLLFHVPNGGKRSKITAANMKRIGVVAGVADLLLLIPSSGFNGFCIEMKAPKGKQSDLQKEWQGKVERQGYKYILCYSLEQFKKEICNYLKFI